MSIKLNKKEKEKLLKISKEKGISQAEVVREGINAVAEKKCLFKKRQTEMVKNQERFNELLFLLRYYNAPIEVYNKVTEIIEGEKIIWQL